MEWSRYLQNLGSASRRFHLILRRLILFRDLSFVHFQCIVRSSLTSPESFQTTTGGSWSGSPRKSRNESSARLWGPCAWSWMGSLRVELPGSSWCTWRDAVAFEIWWLDGHGCMDRFPFRRCCGELLLGMAELSDLYRIWSMRVSALSGKPSFGYSLHSAAFVEFSFAGGTSSSMVFSQQSIPFDPGTSHPVTEIFVQTPTAFRCSSKLERIYILRAINKCLFLNYLRIVWRDHWVFRLREKLKFSVNNGQLYEGKRFYILKSIAFSEFSCKTFIRTFFRGFSRETRWEARHSAFLRAPRQILRTKRPTRKTKKGTRMCGSPKWPRNQQPRLEKRRLARLCVWTAIKRRINWREPYPASLEMTTLMLQLKLISLPIRTSRWGSR